MGPKFDTSDHIHGGNASIWPSQNACSPNGGVFCPDCINGDHILPALSHGHMTYGGGRDWRIGGVPAAYPIVWGNLEREYIHLCNEGNCDQHNINGA